MRLLNTTAAVLMLAAGGAQAAGLSSTVAVTSDYDFRGFSRTDEDPALQASLDFSAANGWYVGAWASNVDFPGYDGSVEVDLYTGFSGTANGLGWDAGLVWYTFPSSDGTATEAKLESYPEVYARLTRGVLSGALWYTNDYFGTDESAIYLESNVDVPLRANFSLHMHLGYSFGDYWKDVAGDRYFDYSVGLGYAYQGFTFTLKYVDTDSDAVDDRAIFYVSRTFGL
ncbi:MAG: hypothetical protein DIU71_17650 [Proteobacteria bacterium]|nr:MAG: hypothetical protein DIU71_17650 [Pseudomonadota bacterium]